jgi:UDP-GlcNAc:undecaprenyl-phosphate GlcNAc-1-phosphate transferase
LIFNLPPAKIFLGDGGAYLIGFFIASVSLFTSNKGSVIGALLVIIMALGVPILDTLFAIIRRAVRGVPIFNADAEHIHHRLILLGFSKGRALVALYSVCLALSLVGLSVLLTRGVALPVAGAVLLLLALGAARYLGYVRSWSNFREQLDEVMERRRKREFFRAYGRVLDFEVERCDSLESFSKQFEHGVKRMGLGLSAQSGSVPETLKLVSGMLCTIHHPQDGMEASEWHLRLDVLLPALERCVEKWGSLPSSIEQQVPNPTPAPSISLQA